MSTLEPDWERAAADLLGCGYRVVVPEPAALPFARAQAREVLARCGIDWDDAPWSSPASSPASSPSSSPSSSLSLARSLAGGPVEVAGGAPYDVGSRRFGPVLTRIVPLTRQDPAAAVSAAVDLPWWWSSDGPLAGLPTISGLEAAAAARQLDPGTAGLWWNHRDELCTSTAGPLLLRLDDGWVHPDDAAGAVPSWAWAAEAAARGSRPARVDRSLLGRAVEVVAVSPLREVVRLERGSAPSR